jgi:sugar phosphate isomerase/epimerase
VPGPGQLDDARPAPLSPPPVVRFSLSQITTPGWTFERDVEAIAATGAPGIGVSIRKLEVCGLARAARLIREAGLGVSCLAASGFFPLGDPDGERAALERAALHIDAAAELGAGCLLVMTGNDPRLSWEEAAARVRPLLEALLPRAEATRVRLALEPTSQLRMDLAFLHTFEDALDYVGDFASPWLGVVLELNNAWIERGLYENILRHTAAIALVQVSDFKVGTLAASERVMIGDGDIPLRRICRALADAGYGGWYDIELLGPAIEAAGYDVVVARALERFRQLWT